MLAISKLRALEDKYLDLEAKISDPDSYCQPAFVAAVHQRACQTGRSGGGISGIQRQKAALDEAEAS
jgi:hypothetical protein